MKNMIQTQHIHSPNLQELFTFLLVSIYDILSHNNEIKSQSFDILSHNYEIIIDNYDTLSKHYAINSKFYLCIS